MPAFQLGLPANSHFTNCTIHISGNPFTLIPRENPHINPSNSITGTAAPAAPQAGAARLHPGVSNVPSPAGATRLGPAAPETVGPPANPAVAPAAEVLQPSAALNKENQGHPSYEEAQRDALV